MINGKDINLIFNKKNEEYINIINHCYFFTKEYEKFLSLNYNDKKNFTIKAFYFYNQINNEIKCSICDNYATFGRDYANGFNKTCSKKCSIELKNKNTNQNSITNHNFYFNFKELKDYINKYIKKESKFIFLNNYKDSDIFLNSIFNLFDKNIYSINEIIYLIYNNNEYSLKQSICKCGNKNKFLNHNLGFNTFCSNKCGTIYSINKIKETKLKKYGNENYNNSSKRLETNSKNIDIISNNISKSLKEKYLDNDVLNDMIIKTKKTKLEKYGNENYNNIKKRKETNLEKYGVDHFNKQIHIKEKQSLITFFKNRNMKPFYLNKLGVDNPSKDTRIKLKKSLKMKNNFKYIVSEKYRDFNYILSLCELKDKVYYFDVDKYMVETNASLPLTYRIFYELEQEFPNYNFIRKGIYSKSTQLKIYEYIVELLNQNNYNYIIKYNDKNTINPLELDIYIEIIKSDNTIQKIGIEYNGLMFHSIGISKYTIFNNANEEHKYKEKHLVKTELCEEKGIKLFHIFENEWLDPIKQNIWKSMIHNYLQLIDNKIYARKCVIKELKSKDIKDFLNNNHIQGSINSSINLGLYFENELVSVMTFGKSRENKTYEYELYRFCNLINTNVVGAFSKLLKYFEKKYNPKSIISYGNRRWTNIDKNVYKTNNFILDHISKPNFFYFNNKYILYSRLIFQKHKLELYYLNGLNNIIEYDNKLSANNLMYLNNYRKIYDSGNLVYIFKYHTK